jgi:hypothetical protein
MMQNQPDASTVDAWHDDASPSVDAAAPLPGTWGAMQVALDEGRAIRRTGWPAGFLVKEVADGTLRSSSNGGASYTTPWTPTQADVDATDWNAF